MTHEIVHEVHDVPGADGVTLRTEVFRPDVAGPVPAALHATPYGAHLCRDDAARHAADGVAVVTQDVRGRFGSTGVFDLGATAGRDGAATIGWLRSQTWCDGRVVGRGASFGGYTQLATALEAPASLDSIAPVMAPDPWRGLQFRGEGGAIRLGLLSHWLIRQAANDAGADEDISQELLGAAFEHYQVLSAYDGYAGVNPELAASHPTVGRLPITAPSALDALPHWRALWDEVFESGPRSSPDEGATIEVPTLVVIGWYDLFVGSAIETSDRAVHPDSRLVIVPSGHGFHLLQHHVPPHGHRYGLDVDHRWALERLHGVDAGFAAAPRVTYWCFGSDTWETSDAWPPVAAHAIGWDLAADGDRAGGRLVPSADVGQVEIVGDPRSPYPTPGGATLGFPPGPVPLRGLDGAHRPDVATFVSAPVDAPLTLTGPVAADVWISADVADLDLVAVLSLVDDHGAALAILNGCTRLRHHLAAPVDLREPTPVHVDLGPIAWRIAPGARLRLDLTTSDFPRYDRNLHTGGPEGLEPLEAAIVAHVSIHTGPDTPSRLHLTVLPEEPSR